MPDDELTKANGWEFLRLDFESRVKEMKLSNFVQLFNRSGTCFQYIMINKTIHFQRCEKQTIYKNLKKAFTPTVSILTCLSLLLYV